MQFSLLFCISAAKMPAASSRLAALLAATAAAAAAAAPPGHPLATYTYAQYRRDFGKGAADAGAADAGAREQLFLARRDAAVAHNLRPEVRYLRTVNHLSDRHAAELGAIKGLDRALHHHQVQSRAAAAHRHVNDDARVPDISGLPDSVAWRSRNVSTPVKNQGQCGSCWTFASTETIESHWALKTGNLQELSEQFILDCTPNPQECGGSGGCQGGTAELAYERLKTLGGIPSEWTYPYTSGAGKAGTCHGTPLPPAAPHQGGVSAAANVTGYVTTRTNNYEDLMEYVATKGPLAVSVDASDWHDYAGGIFDGGNHTNPTLDHLVQLVGYGTDDATGDDYWLIRNSWTPLWGERGYIRLLRQAKAPCGWDLAPLDGNGCKGGPPQVQVCGQSGILYDGVYPLV